nr:MAG TPA: RNA polymerase sigma factor [Caudoviricetes sp.]
MRYTPGMIVKLLPLAFDKQRGWGVSLSETHIEDGMPKGKRDPSEGGDMMALCADAQRAYWHLSQDDRNVIGNRPILDVEQERVAQALGMDVATVRRHEFRIVREMCEFLNGCPLDDGLDDDPMEVTL